MAIKLLMFFSESEPYDKGIDLTNEKDGMIWQYKNYFDEIIVYTPKILRDLGYNQSVKEYDNAGVVSVKNYKQNFIGFCAWKPLIIKLELLKSNNNDIIFYHDVNCTKYPQYLLFKDIKNTINTLLEKCNYDFFIPQEDTRLVMWCKTNVIRELGNDHKFNYNFKQLCVNCMIFKNTNISLSLLDEWIECCNNETWLNGETYGSMHKDFIWHCPEQSILNNIIANWIKTRKYDIPIHFPFVYFNGRNINNINNITDYNYLKFLG